MAFVYIKHPDVEGLGGPVPRHALEYWETKGWAEVDGAAVVTDEDGNARTIEVGDNLSRAELETLAGQVGVDPSQHKTKADLQVAIQTAAAGAGT